jgi:hypothetical protein
MAELGELWAYRERAHDIECPLVKAEVVQLGPPRSNKVRVRLLDGEYAGIDMWTPTVRLRVPWDDVEAWHRDELAMDVASEASHQFKGTLEYEAAETVFYALHLPHGIVVNSPRNGILNIGQPEAAAGDLGVDLDTLMAFPCAFIDRHGEYYASAEKAGEVARLLCARYEQEVLAAIADEAKELRLRAVHGAQNEYGVQPVDKAIAWLRKREPVLALVHAWCGDNALERFDELMSLRIEVDALRTLIMETANAIRVEYPQLADRLERRVNRTKRGKAKRN